MTVSRTPEHVVAQPGRAGGKRRRLLLLLCLLLIPYLLLVARFWYVTDDAFISYRYARNLVLGHGLRYNPGESPPVEGYSNFLWVLLCALFELVGVARGGTTPLPDPTRGPVFVSAACGIALLCLVFDRLRRHLELPLPVAWLATLTLACFPPFAVWSTSGLETMPFALLVFLTFDRLILRRNGPGWLGGSIAGLLLALIRVEGIGWVVVILLAALVADRQRAQRRAAYLRCGLLVVIGYLAYFVWRYAYYQSLLPNTAYAKADLDLPRLLRGVNYVACHVLTFITPMLIVPGTLCALRRRGRGPAAAALAWAFPAYAIVVTGDFMAMGRFLIPGLAFNTLLLGWLLADIWQPRRARQVAAVSLAAASLVLGLLPGFNWHLVPTAVRERFRFRFNTERFETELEQWHSQVRNVAVWTARGRALRSYVAQHRPDEPRPSFVAGAIGATGYYSGLHIYDRNGLVTPAVARRAVASDEPLRSPGHDKEVPPTWFLSYRPTVLQAAVVRHRQPAAIAELAARWAEQLRRGRTGRRLARLYVTDVARVPATGESPPAYLIAWVRIPESQPPAGAWQNFEQRLAKLRRGEHLPALP